MSDDKCDNDCVLPLRFPRRPGENLSIAHGKGCLCCIPESHISSDNRPALSHFNYRIGTYGTIREWLLHQINQTPKLKSWTHRTPDDPAIALLEGASILGDILTFYQETYANEAFLKTARWRESISDLVRLLGYRLSPAIGGNAVFAFEIKKNEPVFIPARFPLKATLKDLPKPAEFETKEEITAYPWLSRFSLYRPLIQHEIEPSTTEFYISWPEQLLAPVELKAGDRLLMGEQVVMADLSSQGQPTDAAIQAGQAASTSILQAAQLALADARVALGAAQSSEASYATMIEMAGKAVEIAASDAEMPAVNEAVGRILAEARRARDDINNCQAATRDAYASATGMSDLVLTTAGDRTLAPGVSDEDFQAVLAMVRPETEAVDQQAQSALDRANDGGTASNPGLKFAEDQMDSYARRATSSTLASQLADKAASDAAEKAVRLAAIAQSSAAAGASDRVLGADLAGQANALAETAKNDAAVVPDAIDAFKDQAIIDSVAIGAAYILGGPGGAILAGLIAAPVTKTKYDSARGEAETTKTDTKNVKAKTQQVVDTLSASATAAAAQSIIDRANAVAAIATADQLANDAATAAATMARDRAALVFSINVVIHRAGVVDAAADACAAALEELIAAIRAVDIETVRESVIQSREAVDDDGNPERLRNAEIVIVDSVRELHGQKIFKIKGSLKRVSQVDRLAAFKLGRSFHHFGYNGPPTTTKVGEPMVSTATTQTVAGKTTTTVTSAPTPEKNIAFSRLLASTTESIDHAIRLPGNTGANRVVEPPLGRQDFPLEMEVNNISSGMTLVIQATLFGSPNTSKYAELTFVRKISQIKPVTQTWGLMTGSASMVTFDQPLGAFSDGVRYRVADIRDFMLHETVSPMLTIKKARDETIALKGNALNFYGTAEEVKTLNGRRIMLEKTGEEPRIVSVAQVPSLFLMSTYDFPILRGITVSEDVTYADFPNENPFTTVFGNLVDANEGKTLPEAVLGSGDALKVFQNFKLPKAPLTYHIVPENTPSETPEAEIYVDGRKWTKVDSFFWRGPQEQIYIVREDAAGNSWVQFGDGKTGARLTNGTKNVTSIFRIGAGAYGPLKENTKVQAAATIKNLDKIQMPMVATGGAPPEDGENARTAAPGKVQSLGRIVSLKDFEAEAAAIPGVARASSAWQLVDNVPAVVVTVLMETGRSAETKAVRDTLIAYNNLRGAGRTPIVVDEGKRMYVTVSLQYALSPGFRAILVEPEIRRALGANFALPAAQEGQMGLFSLMQRRFGGREYSSSIEGVVQNVDGVLWAKTVAFTGLTDNDDPGSIALPSVTTLDTIVSCDAGHVLSLYDKHLFLTAVTAQGN